MRENMEENRVFGCFVEEGKSEILMGLKSFFPEADQSLGPVWYVSSNTCFQFINNITGISIYFFTYVFSKNLKTIV